MAEHIVAATGTLALVAALFVGFGSLLFGSPRGLWRARAEAAVRHSDAALAAESLWKKWRNRKTKDLQDAEDAAARRLVDYAAARRRYEETCRA